MSGIDLFSYIDPGNYWVSSPTDNSPMGISGYLSVLNHPEEGDNYSSHIWRSYSQDVRMYVSNNSGAGFQPWKQFCLTKSYEISPNTTQMIPINAAGSYLIISTGKASIHKDFRGIYFLINGGDNSHEPEIIEIKNAVCLTYTLGVGEYGSCVNITNISITSTMLLHVIELSTGNYTTQA